MTDTISRFYSVDSWIEGAAESQLSKLAEDQTVCGLAAMPDLHPGKYGPVGIGMVSEQVHPAIVGSDIGCGMGLYATDLKVRKARLDRIAEKIGVLDTPIDIDERVYTSLESHGLEPSPYDIGIGSIGSGNHFCEFQAIHEINDVDTAARAGLDKDFVYILTHSGSRALGASIFEQMGVNATRSLDRHSEEEVRYLLHHDHATTWAGLNRYWIARRAAEASRTDTTLIADVPHNFLVPFDERFLHRKGAAPADLGLVPIPGSRDSLSYLVKPNEHAPVTALNCLAHGAGRKYDRGSMHGRIPKTKTKRDEMSRNQWNGIVVCEDRKLMIEEAPEAYKNIDRVIDDLVRFDLCSVVATFRPLITFKTGQAHIGRDHDRDR